MLLIFTIIKSTLLSFNVTVFILSIILHLNNNFPTSTYIPICWGVTKFLPSSKPKPWTYKLCHSVSCPQTNSRFTTSDPNTTNQHAHLKPRKRIGPNQNLTSMHRPLSPTQTTPHNRQHTPTFLRISHSRPPPIPPTTTTATGPKTLVPDGGSEVLFLEDQVGAAGCHVRRLCLQYSGAVSDSLRWSFEVWLVIIDIYFLAFGGLFLIFTVLIFSIIISYI